MSRRHHWKLHFETSYQLIDVIDSHFASVFYACSWKFGALEVCWIISFTSQKFFARASTQLNFTSLLVWRGSWPFHHRRAFNMFKRWFLCHYWDINRSRALLLPDPFEYLSLPCIYVCTPVEVKERKACESVKNQELAKKTTSVVDEFWLMFIDNAVCRLNCFDVRSRCKLSRMSR